MYLYELNTGRTHGTLVVEIVRRDAFMSSGGLRPHIIFLFLSVCLMGWGQQYERSVQKTGYRKVFIKILPVDSDTTTD